MVLLPNTHFLLSEILFLLITETFQLMELSPVKNERSGNDPIICSQIIENK